VDTVITGAPETFVTGPSTDITATYVSADPSGPSMAVSNVVGPWSANTGNYVVNTVVNPVLIKPETSAIAAVNDSNYSQYGTGTPYSSIQGWEAAFDGNITQAGENNGGSNTFAAENTTMVWTPPTPIPITSSITFYSYNQSGTSCLINGTRNLSVTGNYATPITDVTPAELGNVLTSISITTPAGFLGSYFSGVAIDGELLIDGGTFLTLTNDTDLNQFATGDNIYAAGSGATSSFSAIDIYGLYYEDGSVGTSPLVSATEAAEIVEQNYFNSDINDANKSGDKGFYVYDVNTITIAYSGLTAGDSIGIVAGGASGGASAAALNMSATGDVNNSGNPFVVYDGGGSKDSLPKTRSNIIVNASSGSFVLKSEFASGTTNTSNVLIQWIEGLDGGPSGVVGDITGLDMTLSESTGTWEVGQKVTMDEKPAVVSTANVIFDQTGAVSGISTLPVAGQLILNKDTPKLTFTTPGTGQTWDEELPAGTKLQTSFVATNTEGSSSATSNTVTPGVTTLLAMGQTTTNKEELAQTIVQMETFDERKAIVEGEIAKNKIERKVKEAQGKVKKTGL